MGLADHHFPLSKPRGREEEHLARVTLSCWLSWSEPGRCVQHARAVADRSQTALYLLPHRSGGFKARQEMAALFGAVPLRRDTGVSVSSLRLPLRASASPSVKWGQRWGAGPTLSILGLSPLAPWQTSTRLIQFPGGCFSSGGATRLACFSCSV